MHRKVKFYSLLNPKNIIMSYFIIIKKDTYMKKIKKLIFLCFGILAILTIKQVAYANQFNFSVTPQFPDNQIEDVGYYDILLGQGESQTLTVNLKNTTEKTVVVEEQIASATTNINGVVEYSPNNTKVDQSLKYDLTKYASMPREIILKPNSAQNVEIKVNMPKEAFTGTIAGGITFKEKESSDKSSDSSGVSIKNKYAYVVALLMQQSETKVVPDLKLNEVEPGQVNYRNVINANLQNPKAGYLNQMYVQSEIKGISDSKLSYKKNQEMLQMAPNTNFDYPISIGEGKRLKPGKYRLSMTVYGQKNTTGQFSYVDSSRKTQKFDYRWTFSKEFTISKESAKKLNAQDVTIEKIPWYKNWLLWLILLLLLFALFFFILWKRRKKDEEEDLEKEELLAQLEAMREQANKEDNS